MTLMLRLDPAHLPLWRDADTLQIGRDAVAVVTDPSPWQERLLIELTRGFPDSGIDVWADLHRVHTREVRRFLDDLGALLLRTDPDAPRPPVLARVGLDSAGGGGDAGGLIETVRQALHADGRAPSDWVAGTEAGRVDAVVLFARHIVDPRRAAVHLRADRPHLPVIASGRTVRVGPLVIPGETACTTCVDLAERDRDEAWPRIATQLLVAPSPPVPVELMHRAAAAVLRALSAPRSGSSVLMRAGHAMPSVQAHPPHASCGCRAPQGIATVPGRPARPAATTTGRPRAVPA
jgi:hypothetical protein